MAYASEIDHAIKLIEDHHGRLEYILHAVSLYPCPSDQMHMSRIRTLQKMYGDRYKIGYSHHSPSIIHCVQAAAMGAEMIEFHITEDRNLPGPDHSAAVGPVGFKRIMDHLNNLEGSLGDPGFNPTEEEISKGANYAWRTNLP
jgi:sialic acid synthase SpsE